MLSVLMMKVETRDFLILVVLQRAEGKFGLEKVVEEIYCSL